VSNDYKKNYDYFVVGKQRGDSYDYDRLAAKTTTRSPHLPSYDLTLRGRSKTKHRDEDEDDLWPKRVRLSDVETTATPFLPTLRYETVPRQRVTAATTTKTTTTTTGSTTERALFRHVDRSTNAKRTRRRKDWKPASDKSVIRERLHKHGLSENDALDGRDEVAENYPSDESQVGRWRWAIKCPHFRLLHTFQFCNWGVSLRDSSLSENCASGARKRRMSNAQRGKGKRKTSFTFRNDLLLPPGDFPPSSFSLRRWPCS